MISRDQAKQILDDWQQTYIAYLDELKPRSPQIKPSKHYAHGLVGVRRCGKSWAAIELAASIATAQRSPQVRRSLYLNFEDPAFMGNDSYQNIDVLLSVDAEFEKTPITTLILDEIQNIQGWERWVRKAVDSKQTNIMITGSSAKLLSSELATSLTGRCLEHRIWPLSYKEFLNFTNRRLTTYEQHRGALSEYLQWGGFPAVVLENETRIKKELLKQYALDIVSKDVVARNAIRDRRALDQMTRYYATNISSLHSYQAIRKAFDITVDMAVDYTRYLNDAFYCFEVQRFHPNMKVQIRDPKKIYGIDTGLRNVLTQSVNQDRGKLVENVVFIELMRRGYDVNYYRGERECDFVLTENGSPHTVIQVTDSNLEEASLKEREIRGLLEAAKATKLKSGVIVTDRLHETRSIENVKIQFIPLHMWLTSDSAET